MGVICDAIRTRSLLEFQYDGLVRVVAPYCHGVSKTGHEVVRAVQLRGASSSGAGGLGFGKLWKVSKLVRVRLLDEHFAPTDDPDYNPDDSALATIHCRV
jgi:hypothetical protein